MFGACATLNDRARIRRSASALQLWRHPTLHHVRAGVAHFAAAVDANLVLVLDPVVAWAHPFAGEWHKSGTEQKRQGEEVNKSLEQAEREGGRVRRSAEGGGRRQGRVEVRTQERRREERKREERGREEQRRVGGLRAHKSGRQCCFRCPRKCMRKTP
eukprot:3939615-Rhodomonas_salina.1